MPQKEVIIRYKCNICGKEFYKEEDANKCEIEHKVPVSVNPHYKNGREEPESIYVMFEDGMMATYHYVSPYRMA